MNHLRLTDGSLVEASSIIGIFDLDTATEAKETRRFLRTSEADGRVAAAVRGIPRSFLLCDNKVYLTHASPNLLLKDLEPFS